MKIPRKKPLPTTIAGCLAEMEPVCKALQEIRDKKLYRSTHPTFEAYVREEFCSEALDHLKLWEEIVAQRN